MRIDDPGKLVFHAQEAVISIRIAVKVPDPPADDLLDRPRFDGIAHCLSEHDVCD